MFENLDLTKRVVERVVGGVVLILSYKGENSRKFWFLEAHMQSTVYILNMRDQYSEFKPPFRLPFFQHIQGDESSLVSL